ncbi:YIP1 family protein [Cognatishimia sp. SS12]|uniref:YIP1 family protein n=1 Tax=Cognatishimia sp. SS12 TaxID=2979465 RepID=UPI00232E0DFD|nr:YIP1 family protein [Cognatishimia sp. SS12]MDC0737256.1 YIP1 family protein [Cognatishimia sp. SS12]
MSILPDILATYRGPRAVYARRLPGGPREDRALALLMAACGVIFVAQWPKLARVAHIDQVELNPLLGSQLLLWVFMMPLFFYVISLLAQGGMRLLGKPISGYGSRIALFWALLATTPIALFRGLVGGFIGTGTLYDVVGLVGFICFFWFWTAGLQTATKAASATGA